MIDPAEFAVAFQVVVDIPKKGERENVVSVSLDKLITDKMDWYHIRAIFEAVAKVPQGEREDFADYVNEITKGSPDADLIVEELKKMAVSRGPASEIDDDVDEVA